MSARPMSGMGLISPPPTMSSRTAGGGPSGGGGGGGGIQQQQHQHRMHLPNMRSSMPSNAPPPTGSAPIGPPGSLPPGTLVRVGPYTVTIKRYLSQGGFATVYLCNTDTPLSIPNASSGSSGFTAETTHVLKRIVVPDKETLAEVRREVEVHKLLRHDASVVHFLEASALSLAPPQQGYEVYILMEYCSGGGLLDLLNSRLRNRLSEVEVLTIFADICKGVAAMHHLDPPVLHRDLKIENILLATSNDAAKKVVYKLCDFGSAKPILSRRAPRSMEELKRLEMELNKTTTLPYRPPEMVDVYQRKVIDEKADIWALGVLLYKLCYYTTPFEENGGGPLAILNVKYRFPANPPYSDRVKGLIASILVDPSTRRPSIDDLLITVHKLLGTPPPASAVHYSQMAKGGQQAQALPRVVDSKTSQVLSPSSSSSPTRASHRRAVDDEVLVRIARERHQGEVRATPGGDLISTSKRLPHQLAEPISSSRSVLTPPTQPSHSKEDGIDLITFQSSQKYDKLPTAAESERIMKLEGVTPMRRGRPTTSSTPTKTGGPPESVGKLDLEKYGLSKDPSVSSPSVTSTAPHIKKVLPISIDAGAKSPEPRSRPSSSKIGTLIDGFGDSFAPEIQIPMVGTTSQGPRSPPLSPSEAERKVTEFVRRGEGSTSTPLVLSPTLPGLGGMSAPAMASPLVSLTPSTDPEQTATSRRPQQQQQQQQQQDRKVSLAQSEGTAAAGRFPSLEELDRRYPSPPKIITPNPDAASVASMPSAAKRASMASLAGNFSGLSTTEGRDRPTPLLPPRKPWQQRMTLSEEKEGQGQLQNVESKESTTEAYRSPARFGQSSSTEAKQRVKQADNTEEAAKEVENQDDSSDDEDEEPETIDGGASAARQRWSSGQKTQSTQEKVSNSDVAVSTPWNSKPGKVKQPDWVAHDAGEGPPPKGSVIAHQPPRLPPSTSKPLIDLEGEKARSMASPPPPMPPAKDQSIQPSKTAAADAVTTGQSRAPAWDWDADEGDADEMRALTRPRLDARVSADVSGGLLGQLIDVKSDSGVAAVAKTKPTSSAFNLREIRNVLEERGASTDDPSVGSHSAPVKHSSTDSAHSATAGLPSRQRLALGKSYLDAATSPAIVSPASDSDGGVAHSPSPSPTLRSPSPAKMSPSSSSYEEPKKYPPGTAQSMASRWESLKTIGPAGDPKERSGVVDRRPQTRLLPHQGNGEQNWSISSFGPSSSSSTNAVASSKGTVASNGPTIIRPMPNKVTTTVSSSALSSKGRMAAAAAAPPPAKPSPSLKPWEREAVERAEVERSHVVKSGAPNRIHLGDEHSLVQTEEKEKEEGEDDDDDEEEAISSSHLHRHHSQQPSYSSYSSSRKILRRNGTISAGSLSTTTTTTATGTASASAVSPSPSTPEPEGSTSTSALHAQQPQTGVGVSGAGDAQRYRSVASLIDQWQANAKSSKPESGWGEIGGGAGGAGGAGTLLRGGGAAGAGSGGTSALGGADVGGGGGGGGGGLEERSSTTGRSNVAISSSSSSRLPGRDV